MTTSETLGGLQQLVMLAVARLGSEADGGRILEELEEVAGRRVTIGTVYVTLERLERKGLAESWLGAASPSRGGKARRYYRLSPAGKLALVEQRRELLRMWSGLEALAEGRDG